MRFIFLLFALITANTSIAQDWYQIEVILFEHRDNNSDKQDQEHWPRDLDLGWPSPILELEPAVKRPEPVALIPAFEELVFEQRSMNNDSYALRVREPYAMLWHKAWRAPLQDEQLAPWILVQASEQLGDHHRLEGAIRIHLSRYLHLSTDLWLTEVSGNAVLEEETLKETTVELTEIAEQASLSLENSTESTSINSEFDWSQLPEPKNVRWGCNYIRERWPEDARLLPEDFYEAPAPADWYYPFGCRIPSESIDHELPYSVSMPTSDRDPETELKSYYPELFINREPETEYLDVDGDGLNTATLPADTDAAHQARLTGTITDGETTYPVETMQEKLLAPAPKLKYPVKEIIHIKGKRRMRSGEFHYIDHPRIGVLALIKPVEKPELELEPETSSETGIETPAE